MRGTVAVDDDLGNVRQALAVEGYRVIRLTDNLDQAEVVVVSGMDENIAGDLTMMTDAPVIDASGYTAEEIIGEVKKYTEELV